MRRMTLLWLVLAAVCGGVLFHTSQQVNDGRQRLAVINDDIRKEDETLRVLQAEWSYLNQPDRLEKLSKQYLQLAPLKGRQFAKLQDVADRAAVQPVVTAPQPVVAAAPAQAAAPAIEAAPAVAAAPVAETPPVEAIAKPVVTAPVVATAPQAPSKPAPAKAAAAKPAAVKPAPVKTASTPFVVKFRKPYVAAPAKHVAPVATAESTGGAPQHSFSDMLKGLGVH